MQTSKLTVLLRARTWLAPVCNYPGCQHWRMIKSDFKTPQAKDRKMQRKLVGSQGWKGLASPSRTVCKKLTCCILLSSFLRQNALTVPQNPFSPHARVTKIAGEFLHWHVFASLHFSHGRTICLHRIWSFIHIHPSQQNTSESIASILLSLPFTISDCSRPRGPETCQGQTCWMQSIVPNKHCFFPSCRKTHSLAKNHVSQDRLQLICQGPNSWPLTMSVSLWLLRWAHKTWKIAY